MDRRSTAVLSLSIVTALALLVPAGALAKGKPVVETTNNLSFPAIAVDGFTITPLEASSFTVPYAGTYPGLTADQITALGAVPWYAQKVAGNAWQADYLVAESTDVDVIDWGDNIESVDAFVRRPFRLEVVLFDNTLTEAMTGYTMALLEYPSSPSEVQGTDATTYEGSSATVVSTKPKLVIQALGTASAAELTWNADLSRWVGVDGTPLAASPIGFAPELNVAGKYIFGASTGGWKPTAAGLYRITFYIPADSKVNLRSAVIAEPLPEAVIAEAEEGGGATPVVDSINNLTYVDVVVQPRTR